MEGITIIYNAEIEQNTRKTIRVLLKEHHKIYGIDLTKAVVEATARTGKCAVCKHRIKTIYYTTKTKTGYTETIVSYTTCDCGYVSIFNLGNIKFERRPGQQPTVAEDPWLADNIPITEYRAAKIIESNLVTSGEG